MDEIQELRARVAELSAQLQTLAVAVTNLSHDSGGGGEDFSQDDSWQEVVPGPGGGGGGSHMGNKAGSVKFDGEATFASASDANVEVLTQKTNAQDEAEKGTITIGVYWK